MNAAAPFPTHPITTDPITTDPITTLGGRLGRAHGEGLFRVTWFGRRSHQTFVDLSVTSLGDHRDRWQRQFGQRQWSTTLELNKSGQLDETVGRVVHLLFSVRHTEDFSIMSLQAVELFGRIKLPLCWLDVTGTTQPTPTSLAVAVSVRLGPITVVRYEGTLT